MNKAELIEAVASKAKLSKSSAEAAINAVVASIGGALRKGEEIRLTGFGAFVVKKRKARKGVNPSNGKPLTIPAGKVVRFRVSKALKEKL